MAIADVLMQRLSRRGLLKRAAVTAAGVALATTPEVQEATRRWWPGWRAEQSALDYVEQLDGVVAGRDVSVTVDPWATPWDHKGYTKDGLRFRMVDSEVITVDQQVDPVLHIPTMGDERVVVLRPGYSPLRVGDLVEWANDDDATVRRLDKGHLLGVLVGKDPDNLRVYVQTSGIVHAPSGVIALPG